MVRLLKAARSHGKVAYHNHQRKAKRRRVAIFMHIANANIDLEVATTIFSITKSVYESTDTAVIFFGVTS